MSYILCFQLAKQKALLQIEKRDNAHTQGKGPVVIKKRKKKKKRKERGSCWDFGRIYLWAYSTLSLTILILARTLLYRNA